MGPWPSQLCAQALLFHHHLANRTSSDNSHIAGKLTHQLAIIFSFWWQKASQKNHLGFATQSDHRSVLKYGKQGIDKLRTCRRSICDGLWDIGTIITWTNVEILRMCYLAPSLGDEGSCRSCLSLKTHLHLPKCDFPPGAGGCSYAHLQSSHITIFHL
jgi:hypothetical protein